MGWDLSALFVPRTLETGLLRDLAGSVFKDEPDDLVALLVDETTGPAALRERFPRYTSVSLWSGDPVPWDRYARALSGRLPGEPCLALVMADHASVGGWQLLQDGKAREGVWSEHRYTTVGLDGFERAYGFRPAPQGDEATFFTEALTTSAQRGVCLRSVRGDLPAGKVLDAAAADEVISAGSSEWICCLLDLTGARQAEPPPPPPRKEAPPSEPPGAEDVALAEALGALKDLTPVRRMTADMLRKQVLSWGKPLSEAQRREARQLLGR